MKPLWWLIFLALLQLNPGFLSAQVVLNEICTYNGDLLEDENGDESDWIELYNAGTFPVMLKNYSLHAEDGETWFFPSYTIQPQEYLVIFASGKNRTSPNLHTNFKLSKEGETIRFYNAAGTAIDFIATPLLHIDHSFGRKPDGVTGTEGIFDIPSAGSSNQDAEKFLGYTPDPVYSLSAGVYNGSRILEITGNLNAEIRFTVDGSIPNALSPLFPGQITIDNTMVVKARTFSNLSTSLPSNVISNTYILNYNQSLPVFSISTHPDNLWDWDTGIYVTGPNASSQYPYYGANYWQDWEVPAQVEFFESDGTRKFSQTIGLSINGGSSNRTKPMKSLRLSNKSKFGEGEFRYRFFENKAIDAFKIIVLRNSSGDFNKTHFRDGSLHQLMIGKTNIDLSAYRPSAVFLNGVYHGVHNIREKISKYYLEENFGVDEDNVDLLEEDSLVIEGDFNAFNSMYTFVTGSDMAQQDNFSTASQMIDTESLCDYYIAETFLSNIDWPYNNIKFWKERAPGSKWRYILIDLDIALGNNGWAPADFDILGRIMGAYGDTNRHVHIFKSLLQNPGFKEYFINRYADLVNTLFLPENMERHILATRETLVEEMPMHFDVWGNTMLGWDQEIFQVVMPHIYNRPAWAMQQVQDVFDLEGIHQVELDVWPPGAGTVFINTISPGPLPWKGNYFDGNPITIQVFPNPGFKFIKWDAKIIPEADLNNSAIRFNPAENNRFTAFFGTSDDKNQLMVYPNPAQQRVQIGCLLTQDGRGRIEVVNATGQKVLRRETETLFMGVNKWELEITSLASGVFMLNLITNEGIKSARLVIL